MPFDAGKVAVELGAVVSYLKVNVDEVCAFPALSAATACTVYVSPSVRFDAGSAYDQVVVPVAVTSIALGLPLELGLPPKEVALLALSLLLSSMTLAAGRATVLQGAVHLVVFAVFVFLAMVP